MLFNPQNNQLWRFTFHYFPLLRKLKLREVTCLRLICSADRSKSFCTCHFQLTSWLSEDIKNSEFILSDPLRLCFTILSGLLFLVE